MEKSSRTNILVGAFAIVILALVAYGAVRLGPSGFDTVAYREVVVYVPSAQGLYEETAVRIAGVQVGTIKEISLEGNHAKVTVRLREDVELYPNARASVRSEGLLGDRYIDINPGSPDPEAGREKAGPPKEERVRIIYADEVGGVEALTEQLGETGKNLEAITENIRAVLENRPGGNPELARTLDAMARLTSNLAEITAENRADLRELIYHLRRISETLDQETPRIAGDLRELVSELNGIVRENRDEVDETLASFRRSSEKLEASLGNVQEITRKINEGEGTIGKLVNDDETITELNKAIKGVNDFLAFADRLELRVSYRGEYHLQAEDTKNVIGLELWTRPDKFYRFALVTTPRPGDVTTTVSTQTNTVGNMFFPTQNTQTTSSFKEDELRFTAVIGKRWEYFSVFGGLIETDGGVGASFSPDAYKHWDFELTAFGFGREESDRPILRAEANFRFWKYFYLTAGVEDFIAEDTDDIRPFFGGGLQFVEEDLKPFLSQVDVSTGGVGQ